MWQFVIPHFQAFIKELDLSPDDRKDADGKADRIARSLFAKYYPNCPEFDPSCYLKLGSYGKGTAASCDTDLDLMFILPSHVFHRINALAGNKQSHLLQEVKKPLLFTFPRTLLNADGPIIQASFNSYQVELIPAFLCDDGTYLTANTANGGSWRYTNPEAELLQLRYADDLSVGKATHLTKMLKAWKYECNVEIKSISLEVLACVFVDQWQFRDKTIFYYDWMMRDFFQFMQRYVNGWTRVPGTSEIIQLGDSWATKCDSAYKRACKACEFEHADLPHAATLEWQKIFGPRFTGSNWNSLLLKAFASA